MGCDQIASNCAEVGALRWPVFCNRQLGIKLTHDDSRLLDRNRAGRMRKRLK